PFPPRRPADLEGRASRALVDVTVVVDVDRDQQLARLRSRDSLTREQAEARLAAQPPLEEKTRMADYVIDNRRDLARTREQVRRVWEELTRGENHRPDRSRQQEGRHG